MATERNIGTGRRKLLRNPLTDGIEMGKVPPHAIDLEEAVLGALMLEKDALNDVIEVLKPDSFYKNEHRLIFEAIVQLFNDSKPIDILTVTAHLRKVRVCREPTNRPGGLIGQRRVSCPDNRTEIHPARADPGFWRHLQ
jgi:hypothetical protein